MSRRVGNVDKIVRAEVRRMTFAQVRSLFPTRRKNPSRGAPTSDSHRLALDVARSSSDAFESYYDMPPDSVDEATSTKHLGRRVTWLGEPGRMLRVPAAYVTPREDNIFDPRKLGAVISWLRAGNHLVTYAPMATVMRVDRELVEDTQRAARGGRLESEYAMSRPFTTGHRDLDRYLSDPDHASDLDEEEISEIEDRVEQAIQDGDGDFGAWWARLRDGNHRALGAVLAGEGDVWVKVMRNEVDQFARGELL